MSLWSQEDQLRRGDEYNRRLEYSLRCNGWSDAEISKLQSPLDKGESNGEDNG